MQRGKKREKNCNGYCSYSINFTAHTHTKSLKNWLSSIYSVSNWLFRIQVYYLNSTLLSHVIQKREREKKRKKMKLKLNLGNEMITRKKISGYQISIFFVSLFYSFSVMFCWCYLMAKQKILITRILSL